MAQDTKNFKVSEFACKCGCGFDKIDQRVMDMAQRVRDEIGCAVRINSGCRCEAHNAKPSVGGVPGSKHTKGLAADLSCGKGGFELLLAVHKLFVLGQMPELSYCIYYVRKNFVHIDCGGKRSKYFEIRP